MQCPCPTDQELLRRFATDADPSAFRSIVTRHGPRVLRVCASVLRDPHEAEDAFQATFLVLVSRASSLEVGDELGRWLCGVAYKTSARLRRRVTRRRERERAWTEGADDRDGERILDRDVFPILREELDRLPEKYRAPLVLCYLEGLTHDEAARHLGWATGTVKVRLVRGRKLLRERLDRRKIALGAILLVSWRTQASEVSPGLARDTARAARRKADRRGGPRGSMILNSRPIAALARFGAIACPVTIAILLGLGLGYRLVQGRRAAASADSPVGEIAGLPANLLDVLAVDCR